MKGKIQSCLRSCVLSAALLGGATALGGVFVYLKIPQTNIVVVYILSVLLIARFTNGYFYGIGGTMVAILLFNWFFTEPYFTLKVNDPTYFITFTIMSITAVITSALTTKVKQAAEDAKEKELESNALYQMTNHLTDAENVDAIAGILVETVSRILDTGAGCVCFDENGMPEPTFVQQKADGTQVRRELDHPQALKRRMEMLCGPFDTEDGICEFPVYGANSVLAVLRVPREAVQNMTPSHTGMLHSIIESTALALERFRSLETQARIREEATQERYRGNLLRAISHDLRTPLSGIMGSGEMLMGMTEPDDPCHALAEGIYKDADWLHALVENILNLTKLQDGRMTIYKEPEPVEEVIGVALGVLEKRFPGREISVNIPDTLIMVPMDAGLMTQVIVNLLDNAVKHTPDDKQIRLNVGMDEEKNMVRFVVSDDGCGISEGDLPYVFQTFYTTRGKSPDARRGIGLGLSICQSIVEAHGGYIFATHSAGGGAEFTFTLPLGDDRV